MKRYKEAKKTNAAGVKGLLIKFGNDCYFRVYGSDGDFKDYAIAHHDLAVTIDEKELATFYDVESKDYDGILDYSPEVYGGPWE